MQYYPFFSIPKEDQQSFIEFTRANPPRFKPQHYHGEDGYANYNYLKVNGAWVDPDSKADVFNANKGLVISGQQPPRLPIGEGGPRFMVDPQELDEFYKGFVQECAEGDDYEGDPRVFHISPATFARWAVGTTRGDSYVERKFLSDVCIGHGLHPS